MAPWGGLFSAVGISEDFTDARCSDACLQEACGGSGWLTCRKEPGDEVSLSLFSMPCSGAVFLSMTFDALVSREGQHEGVILFQVLLVDDSFL